MREMKSEKPKFEPQLLRCLAFSRWASYLLSLSLIPHLYNGNTIHLYRVAMEIK